MKFRQAKKIIRGNSSVHKKYRKRRPPYINEEGNSVWPSLHDIDIFRRAMKAFIHHYKKQKERS